jgi:hypothetical protein
MESIEIKTPIESHILILKKWLTGGDARNINSILLDDLEIAAGGNAQTETKIKGEKLTRMIDKQIETVVMDLDGSSENILQRLLDMRSEDYNFVVEEVQKICNQQANSEKKTNREPIQMDS